MDFLFLLLNCPFSTLALRAWWISLKKHAKEVQLIKAQKVLLLFVMQMFS